MSGLYTLGRRAAVLGAAPDFTNWKPKVAIDAGDTRPMDEYARAVEEEFQDMKRLAAAAKWPADLSSTIVDIDRRWQAAKTAANARKVSVVRDVGPDSALRKAIRDMTTTIKERIAETPPAPIWKKIVFAVLAAGVAGGGILLVRRKNK